MAKLTEILSKEIAIVDRNHDVMGDDELLEKLNQLNNKFSDIYLERSNAVYEYMKEIRFEQVLSAIASKRSHNIGILIAVTETLICVFVCNDDCIERVGNANILPMYEHLLSIQNAELTENVD